MVDKTPTPADLAAIKARLEAIDNKAIQGLSPDYLLDAELEFFLNAPVDIAALLEALEAALAEMANNRQRGVQCAINAGHARIRAEVWKESARRHRAAAKASQAEVERLRAQVEYFKDKLAMFDVIDGMFEDLDHES